ncbi:MAG: hypothetical protein LBI57_05190, partial [Helicobacteraceae bacterium]|nr:hypothetical protein [Helicobacteraceae bacterium]
MRKLKKCCGLLRVAVIASMLAVFIIPLSCGQSSEQPLNAFTATVIDSDPVDEYTFEREEFIETSVSYMDYLTPPTPYPSPMPDTYEQFFNFRLENFSPKTEPLMEERFGKRLGIKKKSLWVYPSYNSFAIGFAANPPVISAIEYGETDSYGNSAPISESYFYNHLHYLKNLKEATIYHYRIIIQDEDGNAIATPDRTFTTKTFGAETKLYQTDFTHTDDKGVSGSGLWIRASGVYVLMEDIASEGLGVNVKADDVTIDLNGHTLIYDNGNNALNDTSDGDYNEHGSWGIRAGLWNFRSANIYNGVIKQGEKGSPGRAPLYLVTMANYNEYNQKNEIAGLTVDYYSD